MFQYVLFDLDGTLTDPKEGITKSVQHALRAFGVEEENLDKLECFIGPPLIDSFMEFYQFNEQQAREAIAVYRQRFGKVGLFENIPYEGIEDMLKECKEAGMFLAVASSKPEVFVKQILEHFGLIRYFDVIVGAELNGSREKKEEVIEECLWQIEEQVTGKGTTILSQIFNQSNCCMVGDRRFDVEGGKWHQLYTVAVGYGYGSREELVEAGADRIVLTVSELKKALLGG